MDWFGGCLLGIAWFGFGLRCLGSAPQGNKQSLLVAAVLEVLFGWDGVHAAMDESALSFGGRRKTDSVSWS